MYLECENARKKIDGTEETPCHEGNSRHQKYYNVALIEGGTQDLVNLIPCRDKKKISKLYLILNLFI